MKRYGRNQKRAHRERIAALEQELSNAEWRTRSAERRVATATSDAFRRYAEQHEFIAEAVKCISYELGRALAPRLVEPAEKILASHRQRSPLLDLSADVRMDDMVTVIRGEIPALRYNVAVMVGPWLKHFSPETTRTPLDFVRAKGLLNATHQIRDHPARLARAFRAQPARRTAMSTRYATIITGNDGEEIVSTIAQMEGAAPEARSGDAKIEKVADGVMIGMVRGGPVDAVAGFGFPAGTEGSKNRSPTTAPKVLDEPKEASDQDKANAKVQVASKGKASKAA